jgi:hypothetical protein
MNRLHALYDPEFAARSFRCRPAPPFREEDEERLTLQLTAGWALVLMVMLCVAMGVAA